MHKNTLSRGLKKRHIQLITLGGIIGSCYFLGSGYVLELTGPAAVISYFIGGLIVVSVMFSLGEMAVANKDASFINYQAKYLSHTWATGVGWSYWMTWVSYVPSEMIAAGIIMNTFIPQVSPVIWAISFGAVITAMNLINVSLFGELEYWLAYIKIAALVGFSAIAFLIVIGLIGHTPSHESHFIGWSVIRESGGFFPKGFLAILLTMVIVLVNFQGSEIVGLAAAESEDPEHTIPSAIRNVTIRIVALYVIPMLLLVMILPWNKAGLAHSVFADALSTYGFTRLGGLFSFIILTAAISTSNSGLYAAARSIYSLSMGRMAPAYFMKLNKNKIPHRATIFSILVTWMFVIFYTFDQSEYVYKYLLALSGFSGAMCWLSIGWTQYRFRKLSEAKGKELKFKAPFFPYMTLGAVWLQIICLGSMIFIPELRASLYIGLPIFFMPMLLYKYKEYRKTKIKEERSASFYH
ncbi:MAG TPA: amino acid permease [Lentisphaeria bacterium]|nr:MAG: amino acid permease [Lentisphaerae bacterium GWF2_38_69]HBM15223.1 amino acid permease [Lentisphaeria bacterium]